MLRFRYTTATYDFAALTARILGVDDLSRLHQYPNHGPGLTLRQRQGMMVKKLYDRRHLELDALMHRFVQNAVAPVFGPIISFQMRACLRIHMHGGDSISAFHRDRDWGQQDDVQNVWIPFTPVWGTNTLWVESEPERGDFQPVTLDYGEAVIFRGAVLRHGSVANDSGATRVSADVRVMPRP